MAKDLNRCETTYVDSRTGTAKCTAQWLLENRNIKGQVNHPISHNNKLTMFICGEEGFADIAQEIRNAKRSIDICCWGFDPGIELQRSDRCSWPRGETYGDLLIDAGRRGVRVRLLVWLDKIAAKAGMAKNMPGLTHGTSVWRDGEMTDARAKAISAESSIAALQAAFAAENPLTQRGGFYLLSRKNKGNPVTKNEIPLLARAEYCKSWYAAAVEGMLANIQIRTHNGDIRSIARALANQTSMPAGVERVVMECFGTHHQKPILIDFDFEGGKKSVGYVMGLNSVTDYWDTVEHKIDDPRREEVSPNAARDTCAEERGFKALKPYRDYACRIDHGEALVPLYNNFIMAWDRTESDAMRWGAKVYFNGEEGGLPCPPALQHKPEPGDSTVQIVRTQPAEQDETIRELYCKAADNASLGFRYLYIENQYFQYEEWTKRLVEKRKEVMRLWNKARGEAKKQLSDMPMLYVFIVIPVPELKEMIPRTYDTLARLGQHGGMAGQEKMIEKENKRQQSETSAGQHPNAGTFGRPQTTGMPLPHVVSHANSIEKPSAEALVAVAGMKVRTAMLNACGPYEGRWRHREIYIHSKLLLVDDVFCTLGSANINQRSMVSDSEINIATIDPNITKGLRKRVWGQLSGGKFDGGEGSKAEIGEVFRDWGVLMNANADAKAKKLEMRGFLLPLHDKRSSTMRLG